MLMLGIGVEVVDGVDGVGLGLVVVEDFGLEEESCEEEELRATSLSNSFFMRITLRYRSCSGESDGGNEYCCLSCDIVVVVAVDVDVEDGGVKFVDVDVEVEVVVVEEE